MGGCHKTNIPAPASTLLRRINSDPDLIILNAAIRRAHLDSAFVNGGPYTFFAPVDSAFINAGLTIQKINEYDPGSLREIIGYHIVNGRIGSGDILGYLRKRFTSLNSQAKPFVSKNYYGIFLNGIHVDEGNIVCGDGVLHKIGRVTFPETGDLYETILRQADLTYVAAILKANVDLGGRKYINDLIFHAAPDSAYYSMNEQDVMQSNGYRKPLYTNFTILLPSDDAFRAAGISIDTLLTWTKRDPAVAASYISTGFVCNEYFTPDFLPGLLINSINSYYFNGPYPDTYSYLKTSVPRMAIATDGRSIYFNDYGDQGTIPVYRSRIIRPDIVATNGVLHITDSVLLYPKDIIR